MIFIFSENDLKDLHPTSTHAERQRFFNSFYASTENEQGSDNQVEGKDMLGEYLEFRHRYKLDAPDNMLAKQRGDDRSDWHYASTLACKMTMEQQKEKNTHHPRGPSKQRISLRKLRRSRHKIGTTLSDTITSSSSSLDSLENTTTPPPLRQYIFARKASKEDCANAKTNIQPGQLILEIRLDQMELKQASMKTHELAVSLYLDRKFHRTDLGQALVCIDSRYCSTLSMIVPKLSVIKSQLRHLQNFYPGRFQEVIIYYCRPQVASAGVYTRFVRGLATSSMANFWGKVAV